MGKIKQGRWQLRYGEREFIVLNWVVRQGLIENLPFEQSPKECEQ